MSKAVSKPMKRNACKASFTTYNKKMLKQIMWTHFLSTVWNHTSSLIQITLTKPTSKETYQSWMEGAQSKSCVIQELFYVQRFFWPWLLAWSPPLAWSAWKCGEQKLGWRQKEVWPKDSEGKKRQGRSEGGIHDSAVRWFSAVGKRTDTSQTTPSSHYPLSTTPTHISPRIHRLPPSVLWGGDICGERLAGKQCVLQFAPQSLQRQTRLRSLPQGHGEVMHFYTHWHIHH